MSSTVTNVVEKNISSENSNANLMTVEIPIPISNIGESTKTPPRTPTADVKVVKEQSGNKDGQQQIEITLTSKVSEPMESTQTQGQHMQTSSTTTTTMTSNAGNFFFLFLRGKVNI